MGQIMFSNYIATTCNFFVITIHYVNIVLTSRHMNFLLIKGCDTNENNVCGRSSFEKVLVSLPQL